MYHLRVGLLALGIHLELALHLARHPVPVPGIHPHAMITPSHPFQRCWLTRPWCQGCSWWSPVAAMPGVAPDLWEHPPAAIPPLIETHAPVQDHRDDCGWPLDVGRVEGRRGSSNPVRVERSAGGVVALVLPHSSYQS